MTLRGILAALSFAWLGAALAAAPVAEPTLIEQSLRTREARLAGDARRAVTSTNIRPPACGMGIGAVNCHIEMPSGFTGSVIIC